ncbi:MAG: hypothetical protein HYU51_10435 [Candidatus Rokubacteria bacterium]|nr:hypothetical protein [Candidatus Rokubacteria bacterium]
MTRLVRQDGLPSMALAVAVWVCTLPFVFVLMVPWLGTRAAITTALALLAGLVVVCWGVCAWDRVHPDASDRREP